VTLCGERRRRLPAGELDGELPVRLDVVVGGGYEASPNDRRPRDLRARRQNDTRTRSSAVNRNATDQTVQAQAICAQLAH
jgi:hypothetical protein